MSIATTSRYQKIIRKHGLDVSIVELRDLIGSFRIAAECYQSNFVEIENSIKRHTFTNFFNLGIQKFNSGKNLQQTEKGVYFLRAQNVTDILFSANGISSCSAEEKLDRLKEGDLLFVRVGMGVGDNIVITKDIAGSFYSDNLIRIRVKEISPFYLSAFFSSQIGRTYFSRVFKGSAQPLISRENFDGLKIPLPSPTFQQSIADLVQTAHARREESKQLYREAEEILLNELGLKNWQPTTKNWSVKMVQEMEDARRADAEYWQPKYDEMITLVQRYKGGCDTLGNLIDVSDTQIRPKDDATYRYCELSNIDPSSGLVNEWSEIVGADLPSRARMKVRKGNVVVSSVAGSADKVALITEDSDGLVASTGFFVVRSSFFSPEVLLVLMKSRYIGELLQRSARGMILAATIKDDFKKIFLPKLDTKTQTVITQKITASHVACAESKELLEKAKRAVEIFVEQDEKAAEIFLN